MSKSGIWVLLPFVAIVTACIYHPSYAYENVGAIYASPDRIVSYEFLEKIAKYRYTYPSAPISGQKFPPDVNDLIPNVVVRDCSDVNFRCLGWDDQAMAVPRRRLSPDDKYVVDGNSFTVVKCLRGFRNICQVGLIRAECHYNRVKKQCVPTKAEGTERSPPWLLYFIYNEDYGVTAFGTPSAIEDIRSVADGLAVAKEYVLVGDNGLLKP